MKNYLILLAGPPATGKSYLLEKIKGIYSDAFSLSPDEVKEMYAESHGFQNLEEKQELEKKVWLFYYQIVELYMQAGKRILISEYPFSDKQKEQFANLTKKYGYQTLTIRLEAEFDVLWERRKERDRSTDRHLSHILSHYKYGDQLPKRSEADNLITKEEFRKVIDDRRYNEFSLGELFIMDVTDFSKADYGQLLEKLKKTIE